jgi:hypothetical protein
MPEAHPAPHSLTPMALNHSDETSTQKLLVLAYELCQTAHSLVQDIKQSHREEAQVLCERQGLDRYTFLKISPGSLVPNAA